MNSTIRLGSLLVVLGCLAWTCHAQDDFSVRANQIVRFFASDSITKQTKEHHVDTLVRFYQKYRNRIQLTPQQRAQADQYVQRYYQEKSQVVMVDGVPRQGGFFTSLITSLIVDLGIELSSAVFSRITSGASSFQVNRDGAVFGILIFMAIYFYRSNRL